jgi:hypothetical protein
VEAGGALDASSSEPEEPQATAVVVSRSAETSSPVIRASRDSGREALAVRGIGRSFCAGGGQSGKRSVAGGFAGSG